MIKQTERYFKNSLPVNVELLIPENTHIFHNHITALMILSGNITVDFFYKVETCSSGDVVLIDACVPISLNSVITNAQVLRIDFNCYYYEKKIPSLSCTFFNNTLIKNDRYIKEHLINIGLMVADTDTPNQHSLDNTAEEFLLSLVKDYQKIHYDYHIPDLIAYISENYYDKQLLSDYAAKKNISENYLSHIVKKESGISFRKLLAQIRCRKALQLLTLPNYRLTDLSFDIGYSSLVYFNNNFKEIYGLLPSDYNIKTTSSESGLSEANDDPAYLTIKLDEFAYRQNISVSAKSDINYSRHYINIDDVISKLPDYMSDIGRIKNINADMNESIHSAFINMRQGFPMNTIVVEVEDAFSHSDTSAYITISKNIYYLQNLGFIVALEMKDLSHLTLQSVINFLGFYGRVYRQNVESIKFMISGDYTSKNVQLFKEQLSHELMSNYNLLSEIKINNPTAPLVNFIPELYDSHVLTPFAMDELFHPERWDKEMDFSLIDNVSKSGMMLRGGNGLLTWNGKQKPWWYAYNFVAKLSGNLISRGEDHLVSSDENKVTIITYNLCNQKLSFLSKISTSEKLKLISEQKGHSREHYFNIYNLHGKYRVTRHEINKSTCLFSKWFDMGCPDYLSDEDEYYLHYANHPTTDYSVIDANGSVEISTYEESFGINCVILERI